MKPYEWREGRWKEAQITERMCDQGSLGKLYYIQN